MQTEQRKSRKNQPKGANLKPPTIYERLLNQFLVSSARTKKVLALGEPFCVGINGQRGSGKTATLSFYACLALAMGLPVYLNFPLEFYLVRRNGQKEHLKAEWINLKTLLKLSKEMSHAFVGISEYQNWAPVYGFNTRVNRFLSGMLHQIRKKNISFFYDAQFEGDVDLHTGRQTDIKIWCEDLYYRDKNNRRKGERFRLSLRDWSGNWTGFSHQLFPRRPIRKRLYFRPFWGCYDTLQVMDPFEALAMTGDDWEEIVFGDDGNGRKPVGYRETKQKLFELFERQEKYKPTELKNALKVQGNKEWQDIMEMMSDLGISTGNSHGQKFYVLKKEIQA